MKDDKQITSKPFQEHLVDPTTTQNQFPLMSESAFCLRGIFCPWPNS